jgi:toxin YoeB
MEIVFLKQAQLDIDFWKKSGNTRIQKKISQLLKSIIETPFTGIGKPEPLLYDFSGLWSRRITDEHRLVYEVDSDKIIVYSLKGHYSK